MKSLFLFIISISLGFVFFSCKKESSFSTNNTIFYNGNILTMTENSDGSPMTVEAILVQDGKIVVTGTKKELSKLVEKNVKFTNLKGKTLMPGFIDGHSHIISYAQTLSIAQLDKTESFDDIIKSMQNFLVESNLFENDPNFYPVRLLSDFVGSGLGETMPQIVADIVYRYMYAYAKRKYLHSWGACAFYALYILFNSFLFNSFLFYSA